MKQSKIPWCDISLNPWIGCSGCELLTMGACYAAVDTPARVHRKHNTETFGPGSERVAVKGFERAMLAANKRPWICDGCGKEGRSGRRIFVGSNCDWLDPQVPVEMLAHMLDVVRRCDQCEIVLLTKRPENFDRAMLAVYFCTSNIGQVVREFANSWRIHSQVPSCVPAHVTLGVSVTDQATADRRIPELLRVPASKRILSVEPLLGPIEFGSIPGGLTSPLYQNRKLKIDGVIVGGMSGPKWREHPMEIAWLESIVRQCDAANVPVWVKQDSGPRPGMQGRIPSELWKRKEWPV